MDQGGDTYQEGTRQVDEQRRGVLPTLPHLRHPVRPETERRTSIRQTVPTKAPVEAETSTIINKRLFFKEFHFELTFLSYLKETVQTITKVTHYCDSDTPIGYCSLTCYRTVCSMAAMFTHRATV